MRIGNKLTIQSMLVAIISIIPSIFIIAWFLEEYLDKTPIQLALISIGLLVLYLLPCLLMSLWFAGRISKEVDALKESIKKIVWEKNYTEKLPASTISELQEITHDLNIIFQSIHETVETTYESTHEVQSVAEDLKQISQNKSDKTPDELYAELDEITKKGKILENLATRLKVLAKQFKSMNNSDRDFHF